MLAYPISLRPDSNGTILAEFLDFPAQTFGDDIGEAAERAAELLVDLLDAAIKERSDLPVPSRLPRRGKLIRVPMLVELKVELYRAMREGKMGKAELARRLGLHSTQVDRLLDVYHASRLDQIETALRALGRSVSVHVAAA